METAKNPNERMLKRARKELQACLQKYKEALEGYRDYNEAQAALEVDPSLINLHKVAHYAAFYGGARLAIKKLAEEELIPCIKGNDKVYAKAVTDLVTGSIRNTQLYLEQYSIGFRNHESKGKKLVKCEAYFYKNVNAKIEVK